MPVHSRDPIDDVVRELITKCAGPKPEWRTLKRMSSIIRRADGAIKEALPRLGDDAVKTRAGDMDEEYLIEGDPDELLIRAGLTMAQPNQSAADSSAEVAILRAENDHLRAKLADADAKIERLKSLLYDSVIDKIAAKLAARGETKPTVDDVVVTALGV
jgi:hypothetical protein